MTKKRFDAFCSLRSQKERGNVVHFSGFARKMNHFPSLLARAKRVRKGICFFVMYLVRFYKILKIDFILSSTIY